MLQTLNVYDVSESHNFGSSEFISSNKLSLVKIWGISNIWLHPYKWFISTNLKKWLELWIGHYGYNLTKQVSVCMPCLCVIYCVFAKCNGLGEFTHRLICGWWIFSLFFIRPQKYFSTKYKGIITHNKYFKSTRTHCMLCFNENVLFKIYVKIMSKSKVVFLYIMSMCSRRNCF